MRNYNNETYSQSTTCQECGEHIVWRSDIEEDEKFSGVISKLQHHMIDVKCSRERKLKILFGTKEKLAQDHWL